MAQDRLHHGWLITGPRGVGKATLAWRIARFLLAEAPGGGLFGPPDTLDVAPDNPVARRIAAGSEPGLMAIRRVVNDKTGKLQSQITVDEVRKLRTFFGLSATDGGRRVVIVDAADELNANAANALLKLLEEPPARAILLLVAHQPSRLLPTIRSRCRELRLAPLGPDAMARALEQALGHAADAAALAELAGGSAGEAVRVLAGGGLTLYAEIMTLMAQLPRISRVELLKLCNSMGGKDSAPRFDLLVRLFDLALARIARSGVTGTTPVEAAPGEARVLSRLAPDPRAARLLGRSGLRSRRAGAGGAGGQP